MPSLRRLLATTFVVALGAAGATVPPSSVADPGPGGFASPNVTWVANIPLDAPGIGGRVLTVDGQRRFYISSTRGLTIYDVTDPALPKPLGTLNQPHFENESMAVSDDGKVAILASDPGFGQPPVTYVIDTSNPMLPMLASVIPDGAHTATCANAKCTHLYGNDGWIYDITDRKNPKQVGGATVYSTHYTSRDDAGLLWTAGTMYDPRKNPAKPTARNVGTGGWHNSIRPNAKQYRPRKPGDTSKLLKPGELVIGNGETWLAPGTCGDDAAGIVTYSIANFDIGKKARKIAEIKPVNGTYADGSPAVDPVGCSAHWFDYRKGIVAAGWYDHGLRFFKIDERTGTIAEVGFYLPAVTEAWAAYWINDEYVYTVDAARGIDIVKFNRTASTRPSPQQVARSWAPVSFDVTPATLREQYLCVAAAERSTRRR